MIINFSFQNFKSFKEKTVLSFIASSLSGHEKTNLIYSQKIKLLKSLLVYGANASGKSNLLEAFKVMNYHIFKSNILVKTIFPEPFLLNSSTEGEPSSFEVEILIASKHYRYGFLIDKEIVHGEWLFVRYKTKEYPLFVRKKKEFKIWDGFSEANGLEERTRMDALFLTIAASFNVKVANELVNWFENILIIDGTKSATLGKLSQELLSNKKERKYVIDLMRKADVNIEDLEYSSESNQVYAVHKKYDANNKQVGHKSFLIEDESAGTEKYFNMIGALILALKKHQLVLIDEIATQLHPNLVKAIIKLFNSEKSLAQLLATTHDVSQLNQEYLRRDQIYFIEKDVYESSILYSLAEFKTRKSEALQKNYLNGKYGAIPFIESLST